MAKAVSLLETLGGARSLALVGLGKNVGKTTALNALVAEASSRGVALGLTSIGRDGELVDAISSHAKPPIRVPAGTLVATAVGELPERVGAFQVVETTDERTALGPVVIARALCEVQWELSGPATSRGLLHIRERFYQLGAQLVLLDGAFDRRSSATPSLTEATLLVSGAALDPDRHKVLEHTRHMVDLFRIPAAEGLEGAEVLDGRGLAVWRDGLVSLDHLSVLGDPAGVGQAVAGASRLFVGRALTSQLLDALSPEGLEVIVRDATHALVSAEALHRFRVRGGKLLAQRAIHMPLVVCNPFSPYGWRFEAASFLEEMAQAAAPLPVVDLVLGRRLHGA